MSDPINVRALAPGTRIILSDGAAAEVVSNPGDGVWLFARYLTSPRDPALIGQEEMIFAAGRRRDRGSGLRETAAAMLELRPNCEYCDKDLPPDAADARICSYECTFCADCVEHVLLNVCPNCGGGFVAAPDPPENRAPPRRQPRQAPGLDKTSTPQIRPRRACRIRRECARRQAGGPLIRRPI